MSEMKEQLEIDQAIERHVMQVIRDQYVGAELPNGARVIDIQKKTNFEDWYVLCLFRKGEYVTWWLDPDRPDSTGLGHYHWDLESAVADLKTRTSS
tara:strand:+ start:1085 stop:1372 length:288 start_codon:yes stop_codon:yes gene_type:complete